MKKLIQALAEIQRNLNAPKGQFNKFGGYSYRSCEDILQAVKPLLGADFVILVTDEITQVGDRYYVKATATITDGEHSINATAYARESADKKGMDSAQITGSTSSYARKYALNGLLLIDDNKDPDTRDNRDNRDNTITADQVTQLKKRLAETGGDESKFLKYLKLNRLDDIPAANFSSCLATINSAAEKRATNGTA